MDTSFGRTPWGEEHWEALGVDGRTMDLREIVWEGVNRMHLA